MPDKDKYEDAADTAKQLLEWYQGDDDVRFVATAYLELYEAIKQLGELMEEGL